MHLHVSQFILCSIFGSFNPTPNMFKMFPHISGLENIASVQGWYWNIEITIEAILCNLDRWWRSLIHHAN